MEERRINCLPQEWMIPVERLGFIRSLRFYLWRPHLFIGSYGRIQCTETPLHLEIQNRCVNLVGGSLYDIFFQILAANPTPGSPPPQRLAVLMVQPVCKTLMQLLRAPPRSCPPIYSESRILALSLLWPKTDKSRTFEHIFNTCAPQGASSRVPSHLPPP